MPEIKAYKDQDFDKIKEELLEKDELWEDDEFPPDDSSIMAIEDKQDEAKGEREFVWKRPSEICDDPQFIIDGIDPNDFAQGSNGDCWFIAALASLARVPSLYDKIVPKDQSFDDDDYAGIFHFHIWHKGEWVDVVVDDYLPVDANTGKLIYLKNANQPNEFFGPLLEKAYAKLNKCYRFLHYGDTIKAMIELTGGVCECFDLRICEGRRKRAADPDTEYDKDYDYESTDLDTLWTFLINAQEADSLFTASMNGDQIEGKAKYNLVTRHIYSVNQFVEIEEEDLKLVKLRNPWGSKDPYTGPWSVNSTEWTSLDESTKDEYDLELDPLGEFYMSWEDFVTTFDYLRALHIDLDAFYTDRDVDTSESGGWRKKTFWGKLTGGTSGATFFAHNPQYKLNVSYDTEERTSVMISMMQTVFVKQRFLKDGECGFQNGIKFEVYKVIDDGAAEQNTRFSGNQLEKINASGGFWKSETITKRFHLKPGFTYVIMPSMGTAGLDDWSFLMRFFVEKNNKATIMELE